MTTNNAINKSPVLAKTGGTMTGTLVLSGNPVNPLDSVPMQYVNSPAGNSIGSISGNWYISGTIYGEFPTNNTDVSRATGTLYFHPFYVSKTSIFQKIGILCSSSVAGTSVLGLYNDSGNGKPTGSPITNSNSGSITNVANTFSSFTFGSTISLSPGVYWTAHSTSGTTLFKGPLQSLSITGRGMGVNATPTLTLISSSTAAGWSQSFSYNATLPSVGSLTSTTSYGAGDVFLFLQAN